MDCKGLDDEINESCYHMLTNDNKKIKINNNIIKESKVLRTIVGKKNPTGVKINVSFDIMIKIIYYIDHYSNSYPVYKKYATDKLENDISDWDIKFLDKPLKIIFSILKASNYLHIQPLIELCSIYIAHFINNNNIEEIQKALN